MWLECDMTGMKKEDKVILSTKDLVFKEQLAKKLTEKCIGPYMIEEIISANIIKLKLLESMRIHLVVIFFILNLYKGV